MSNETNKLSPQQSLDLIASMINQAKGNVRNNSFYFLLWGWIIVAANLGVYTLLKIEYQNPYLIWLIVIPGWIVSIMWGYKKSKVEQTKSHLDNVNTVVWISYGVFAITIPFFGQFINYQINPVILLVGGLCTFISGFIIRFNPSLVGGAVIFCSGLTSFFVHQEIQLLIAAVAIALGYLIPGYMLKSQH